MRPLERIARVVFGVVVVPFFAGLSLILVLARSAAGTHLPAKAPPDVAIVATILFCASIAAYGLDQLLAGIRPARRRWFTTSEERLGEALERSRSRGNLTFAALGVPIRIHWSVILGLFLVAGLQPGGWVGFAAVIAAHELGHAFVVRRLRCSVVSLSFHALGGECQWSGQPAPEGRTAIAWGGVAGQALLFAAGWLTARLHPAAFSGSFGDALGRALLYGNPAMAAFNLLPIPPLDGAEAWRWLFPRRASPPPSSPRNDVEQLVDSALKRAKRGAE